MVSSPRASDPDEARERTPNEPGVDRFGSPVIDPTKNVLDLVTAETKRQDDLRRAEASAMRDEIAALEKYLTARMDGIQRELLLVEERRAEQKTDTKVAVDAALSAAEKAVKEQTVASEKSIIKSETSAAEQSKQQNATFTAALKGVTDLLADLKERVGRLETIRQTVGDERTTNRLDLGAVVSFIALMAVLFSLYLSYGK